MLTQFGQLANRSYTDADGNLHLNGSVIYTDEVGNKIGSGGSTLVSGNNIGTPGTGVTAVEKGNSFLHQTILTLTDVSIAMSDANVGGGSQIYQFPEGRIRIIGATATLTPTTTTALASTINASKTLSTGIGSVQTTTQGSGTLATTQQDIVNQFSTTSSATIAVAGTAGSGKDGGDVAFDGTATAAKAFANLGVPTNTDIDGDGTITLNGTVTLTWMWLGDY